MKLFFFFALKNTSNKIIDQRLLNLETETNDWLKAVNHQYLVFGYPF